MRFFTSKNSANDKGVNQVNEKGTNADLLKEEQSQPKDNNELEAKFAELKDAYLRSLADMENLRQRTGREVEGAKLFGHQAFAKDIINVGEVLEMALASVGKTKNNNHQMQDLVDGLSMTLEEFTKALNKHGISVIDPLHQKFDPNLHTALFEVPTEGVEPGTIVVVEKKGYMLHQRLLRSAAVGVSKAMEKSS